MNNRFKFRTYIPDLKFFKFWGWIEDNHYVGLCACGDYQMPELLEKYTNQCTGLKDKNGLNLLFECDIINMEGIKIGNCYENEYLLKDATNFVIKGMGTKEWRNSEQEAIKRGCYYAE